MVELQLVSAVSLGNQSAHLAVHPVRLREPLVRCGPVGRAGRAVVPGLCRAVLPTLLCGLVIGLWRR